MLKLTIHMERKGRTDIMIKRLLELQSFSINKVFNELAGCQRRTVKTEKLPLVTAVVSEPSVHEEPAVFRPGCQVIVVGAVVPTVVLATSKARIPPASSCTISAALGSMSMIVPA